MVERGEAVLRIIATQLDKEAPYVGKPNEAARATAKKILDVLEFHGYEVRQSDGSGIGT